MVFSSLLFVFLFFTLSLLFYFVARTIKQKNIVLLVFSMIFYAWGGVAYVLVLLDMAFWSWFTALRIEQSRSLRERKIWLIASCTVTLGLLMLFKYTNFITGNFSELFGFPKKATQIILPIGISFYTFQLLSYVVDVYWRRVNAQESYWKLLLYCSLFHQCIAGPIVRYQTVAEEIENRSVDIADITTGIRRFSVGLAKKAILANGCAKVADTLLMDTASATTTGLWLGMLFYMFEIYLDFSAYSDMAIGMGRMVGFHYLENFNYPYIASSVQDFWRRWHISLSSFFKDYVYIPLGGNRKGTWMTLRNMLIVWGLTGMWHGASWNFILWGLYFFVFLALERFVWKSLLEKTPRMVSWFYAMIVVYFGWILFRFENMAEVGSVLGGMIGIGHAFINQATFYSFLNNLFLLLFCMIAVTPLGKRIRQKIYRVFRKKEKVPVLMYYLDAVTPTILVLLSLMTLIGDSYNPFLYFQF